MLTIKAEIRNIYGKSATRRLRLANKLPAIIYYKFKSSIAIELNHDIILNAQSKNIIYNKTIIIIVNGEKHKVKIQEVQHHPFKPKITHIDFIHI